MLDWMKSMTILSFQRSTSMIGVDASQLTWRCSFRFHLQLFKTWNKPPGSLFWLSTLKQCNCWLLTSNRAGSQQPDLHRTQKKWLTSNFQTKHPTSNPETACFGHCLSSKVSIPEITNWNRKCVMFPQTSSRLHSNKTNGTNELPTAWDAGVCSNEFQYAFTGAGQQGRFADDFFRSGEPTKVPTKRHTAMANTSSECAIQMAWQGPASVDFFGM